MAGKTSANPNEFILPDLGEGVHEAELIKWRVKVGDAVNEHDILAEMETDKALVEVPSPRTGVIAALHGDEGEVLHVGNVLVSYVGDGASKAPAPAAKAATPAPKAAAPKAAATPAHEEVSEPSAEREDAGTVVGQMSGAAAGVAAEPGKALATPAVRRLARDLGVDIDAVRGSGIGGRVVEKDVRDAAGGNGAASHRAPAARANPAATPARTPRGGDCDMGEPSIPAAPVRATSARMPATAQRGGSGADETTRVPFRGVRRTIANRLRESISQTVHFTVMDEADVSALDIVRKKLAAASGEKVSFLPFVASAVCRVLNMEAFRVLNATTDDANEEIVRHRAVNLGIATDTENGLMVPVIRDADRLGVLEIGRSIGMIADMARSRSIPREQLMGSTFTISNVGSHAGRFATPIINYPEVGILAVGRARPGPVVRSVGGVSGLFVGQLLPLSLACDHRVVDGAAAALALAEIIKLLQDPEQLLGPARG